MLTAVFAAACWLGVSAETALTSTHPSPTPVASQEHAVATATSAGTNTTRKSNTTMLFNIAGMEQANGVVLRAFYVIVGVMMIILVYFVVRIVRSRYRRSKTRRYGIIASHSAELEMQPLDRADDEEEETTLFEANKRWALQIECGQCVVCASTVTYSLMNSWQEVVSCFAGACLIYRLVFIHLWFPCECFTLVKLLFAP